MPLNLAELDDKRWAEPSEGESDRTPYCARVNSVVYNGNSFAYEGTLVLKTVLSLELGLERCSPEK